MTNKQILKKVTEKAVKNGYKKTYIRDWFAKNFGKGEDFKYQYLYYAIIFSHDFAKAFWGEGIVKTDNIKDLFNEEKVIAIMTMISWQYHLQQMVLEKEPLKYLEQFLK